MAAASLQTSLFCTHLLRGGDRSTACGRSTSRIAPVFSAFAPVFAPFLAVIAPVLAPLPAVIAAFFAALHPRGLSFGLRNGEDRGWQRHAQRGKR
jgi:hypothetical protein